MFLRFTKFLRPVIGLSIALLLLFAPALIAVTVESAPQRIKTKATPAPKKKTTPTPKKSQAKTKATPTPAKSKSSKNAAQTASKNKSASKKNEKTTASRSNQKSGDRNKNSKTVEKKNQKQTLATNNKSRNSKNERSTKTSDKNKNTSSKNTKQTPEKSRRESKNTRTTVAKTTPKNSENRSKTGKTTKTNDDVEVVENQTETTEKQSPQIIVTTFSVPIKSQAKAEAATVSSARLGTVLKVTEKNPAWYKVQYSADGKPLTGWISANAVNDMNAAARTELYGQIVERNYKPQMDFQSATEFYEFTSKVGGELEVSDKSADIELKRLLALRSALRSVPVDRTENAPYKDFLKQQEKEIVYNEPAGQWLVASNQFWNLHNKYKKSVAADNIAWEAANNPLPGECEGYVNCYLFDMRMRFGEYLNLHPNGKHSSEALKNLTDYLAPIAADASQKTVYQGPTDVTDRAEFNNLIAELRTIIARLPFVEKEKVLQQLRTIAEAYR